MKYCKETPVDFCWQTKQLHQASGLCNKQDMCRTRGTQQQECMNPATHLALHASLNLCWCAARMVESPTATSSNTAAAAAKHRACSASSADSSDGVSCNFITQTT
jgi:hypothetical protein